MGDELIGRRCAVLGEVLGGVGVPEADTDQGSVEAGWASVTTLVGIAEAWPVDPLDGTEVAEVELAIAPGAPLHPVHRIPDASDHRALRRPVAAV